MALSFDANYYLSARPDVFHAFVATAGATGKTWAEFAEEHYNTFGRFEGANPNATFNTDEYLAANPDVAAAGVNPFTHYLHFGAAEGRAPSDSFPSFASFDSAAYLAANPDLGAAGIDTAEEAYAHFVIFGQFEDRPGAPAVDNGLPGVEINLTVGPDDRTGTKGNDTFNALPIDANGNVASTLTAFDKLDGGAGIDTLNIYTTATENAVFPANATIKNIEIVNIHNSGAAAALGDASKYEGVTALNQIGANAAAVTNLAATTTAGFNSTTSNLSVQAAATAATSTVALTNVAEAASLTVWAAPGGVLNSVKVSGTRVDATPDTPINNLGLVVAAGKNVESLALDVAVNSTLTLSNEAGSTKALSTVDASASTGSLTYVGAAAVANIKTGAGNDAVTLATAMTATSKAASVSTGAGNDTIHVNATAAAAGATVAVDAGEGNDTINLSIDANANYDVKAGAGDDTVVITGTVKTTDKIDGGDGIDTVSLASKAAYVADDYIVVNKVLTNFETLKLTGATAIVNLDASKLAANYTTIDLNTGSSVVNVGTQALVANGNLTATASGTDVGATPKVYAGSLNITEKATGTITANAATVDLTVDASAAAAVTATLAGFAQSASVNLVQALKADGTGYVGTAGFSLTTAAGTQADLTTLTLSGNGIGTIDNAAGKLITIDASGLNSVTFDGKAAAGLNYTSSNAAAETIKLGAGIDLIKLTASTVGATDTVEGLNLVLNAAGTALDATSDNIDLAAVATFKKFTTSHTDLELALKDAAALGDNDLVFQMGGNTYIYQDLGGGNLVETSDTLVKLTGLVDLDALIVALA
ncbi:beta strand repeat-containing protein [Aerobium aerolatum]|uniref:Uncharacterized protein n=1 Tax=Aquamicrobium aerolatum DSM 21857 TaxID=1121003 RepID=A0A1I3M6P6_9HYPH|nr:hypothetical protein [Aquamicrobium aerolatum]SFI92632.1 hypothetical protein SAMN03080618_01688 [Aquamicrobium aerolatum DSM 21857]